MKPIWYRERRETMEIKSACRLIRGVSGRPPRVLGAHLAVVVAVLGMSSGMARGAAAQIDYRNLDEGRPTVIEDAYSTERYAFELLTPYRFERLREGSRVQLSILELEYGIALNAEVGVKLPFARISPSTGVVDGADVSRSGLAGIAFFGLYNINTEGPILPALAVRADVSLGVGALGGQGSRTSIKAIATRSWGATRLHLNVARGFGSESALAAVDPLDRLTFGAAVDQTLFRRSVLLIGEVYSRQTARGNRAEVNAGLGVRYQWKTTTVLDVGVTRRLRRDIGPDIAFTFGLSHAFAFAGLMPNGR